MGTENGNWSGKKRGDKRCHVVLEPSVLENDSGKWRTLLEETLMTPSPSGMRVLPLILRLQCPRLEAGKERSLLALMGSFLQPAAAGGNTNTSAVDRNQDDHEATDLDIKTLRDVLPPRRRRRRWRREYVGSCVHLRAGVERMSP